MSLMTESPDNVRAVKVYLYPGQLFASGEPHEVTTILGSCVAVCLWDAQRRAGGMNHFLLPMCLEDQAPSARFGNLAIDYLVNELLGLGCSKTRLQAKVFGGSHVLGTGKVGDRSLLGAKNVDQAHRRLADHGIPVIAEDVGGAKGRKLIFYTEDGAVRVKKI